MGFIVAGVGALAGTVLSLTHPKRAGTRSEAARARVRVGPGGFMVDGRF